MAIALHWTAALSAGAVALATVIPLAGCASPARAAEPVAFTIPAEDGYGIGDCMTSQGSACGQEIADAWCVGHGNTRAVAFGAADVTAGIPQKAGPPPQPGAVVIRCD